MSKWREALNNAQRTDFSMQIQFDVNGLRAVGAAYVVGSPFLNQSRAINKIIN
jgi:hypothetical protein